jgi:mannitol-specific phosphotransferase system IIBC component
MLNILNDKKRLIYIAGSVLLVIVFIIITVFILKSINNNTDKKPQTTTKNSITDSKKQIGDLKDQAAKAVQDNQTDQAKKLYIELRKLYIDIDDTNGVAEVDGQLYIINHPATVPKPVVTVPIVTSKE